MVECGGKASKLLLDLETRHAKTATRTVTWREVASAPAENTPRDKKGTERHTKAGRPLDSASHVCPGHTSSLPLRPCATTAKQIPL